MDAETQRRLQDILDYLDRMQEVFDPELDSGRALCQWEMHPRVFGVNSFCEWGPCVAVATTELCATPQSEPLRVCQGHERMLMMAQAGYKEEEGKADA